MKLTARVSSCGCNGRRGGSSAYLFTGLCVEQDPPELDDLGGVLGHIDAVLITGRSNVYHDITVEVLRLGRGGGLGGHDHETLRGSAAQLFVEWLRGGLLHAAS